MKTGKIYILPSIFFSLHFKMYLSFYYLFNSGHDASYCQRDIHNDKWTHI